MNRLNWDDLRFVLSVAEAGSVNAAAKRLGVNHATILRRVGAFEATSGVAVFRRSPTGYTVDPGAASIIEAARSVGGAVDRLERVIAGEAERLSGPIRLTSTDSLAVSLLPRHVAAFQATHPALTLTVLSTNARLDFGRMDAEVAIRPAQALPEDMVGVRVGTMRLRVYSSPDYLARNPSRSASDHVWLGVSDLLSRSPVYSWQAGLPQERIALRADSFVTLAAQVRAGQGLAMAPSILSEGLIEPPGLEHETVTGIWVAAHHDLAEAPRIRLCRRWFEDALSAEPGIAL